MARLRSAALVAASLFPLHVAADSQPSARPAVRPALTIESDSTCPSSPAIGEALALLFPPARWPSGAVRVQAMADTLVVNLISDGITQRQVGVTTDCALRATTVALVIATWTGELTSEAAGAPRLRSQTASPPGDAPVKSTSPPAPRAPPRAASSHTNERELGTGLLLALWGGLAPGVRVDFVQTRSPSGLGWQVGLALPAQRTQRADAVSASWTRAAANIALNGRIDLGRLAVAIDAGVAGAYTFTSGQGFSVEQGGQALTGGLVAGLRMTLPAGRLRLWTDMRAYKWLFPQTIAVDTALGGRVATVKLPAADVQWSAGIAYAFR